MEALPTMTDLAHHLKSPTFLIKILELMLSILAIAMFMADSTQIVTLKSKWAVIFGTIIGFIMISIITVAGSLLKTPLHRSLILMITLPAALLFLAAGGLLFEAFNHASKSTAYLIISGISTFTNGLVYLCDFILTFKNSS
jgi:putative Ca2+/H+ antiporter (TMEM165/GDT1 family)